MSSIFRVTILQLVVPDALRGRLNAINIMFVLGGPQLGQFESGAVAALASPAGLSRASRGHGGRLRPFGDARQPGGP